MNNLELIDVSKSFDGLKAVDQVSIGLQKGKITALIGPNGAGKTTIFNLISGFIKPDSGQILYRGQNIVGLSPWEIASLGIGRLFQDVRVFNRLTVLDNLLAAFKGQKGEKVMVAILGRGKVLSEEARNKEKALELLRFVGLAEKASDLAENLSYGQQKLLSIARLLAAEADVLLLDEPTAGVNPAMIGQILKVARTLAEQGKTVIIIEHNMNVVVEVADWVYFMDDGQIVSFGLPKDVLGDPEVRRAYIGL
jgi:ABC-type branched-subunit amino acid transport system ATPase component